MALRHYLGSTPKEAQSWNCPTCGAENTVPLKAGCQQCGAGADARKVEAPSRAELIDAAAQAHHAITSQAPAQATNRSGLAPETLRMIAAEETRDARRARQGRAAPEVPNAAHNAFDGWYRGPEEGRDAAWQAFVAGLRWAREFWHDPEAQPIEVGDIPEAAPVLAGWDAFDLATQHTILAALAFYRDNQLSYGEIPGQLTAEQVSGFIQAHTQEEGEQP